MEKIDITARVKELNKASEAYYNTGQPIMSDCEFDNKLEELRHWEEETGIILSNSPTHNVGAIVLDNIKEVTHKTPMLSLEKCHSVEEIIKFASKHNLVASVKLDGLTVRLTYKDGDLILAESRGNGMVGSDVTEHVKQFINVPLHINKEGTYIVDGEALIKLDDFAEINKNGEYKNSRNLAAGTLSSLDTSVVKGRKISWYAWEVVEGAKENDSFTFSLMEAEKLGLDVVPNTLQGKTFVVTGSVNHYKNRDELKADIVTHGGTVAGSVSSKTSYLINNDINSTSSKNQKAKSLGIPIISEKQFLTMIQ